MMEKQTHYRHFNRFDPIIPFIHHTIIPTISFSILPLFQPPNPLTLRNLETQGQGGQPLSWQWAFPRKDREFWLWGIFPLN